MSSLGVWRGLWWAIFTWCVLGTLASAAHASESTRRAAQDAEVLEEDDDREGSWALGSQPTSSLSTNSAPSPQGLTAPSAGSPGLPADTGDTSATGQVTSYGYSDDPDGDANTEAGTGIKDDDLTPHTVALSDSMAESLGAQPGDAIEYTTADGTTGIGTYLDRAPSSSNVIDVYSPNGSNALATGSSGLSGPVTVTDLGGGSSTLSGSALSQLGESNAVAAAQKYQGGD